MDNPGVYPLAVIDFSGVSGQPLTAFTDLAGALAVSFDFAFKAAAGLAGTSGYVKGQTTFDGGLTWRDVARFDFTTATVSKQANIEFLMSKAVATYNDLSAEGVNDGVMGDQLRAVASWSGNLSGSTLSLRASVR